MTFTANQSTYTAKSQGNYQEQRPLDRLVTVISVDAKAASAMVMDEKANKKFQVFIDPEVVVARDKALIDKEISAVAVKYMGHKIDEKVVKHFPVGSKMIVKQSTVTKKEDDYSLLKANSIQAVSAPEPEKTYHGLFSMTYRIDKKDGAPKKVVGRIYAHEAKGINLLDELAINKLAKEIDDTLVGQNEQIGEMRVTKPTIGVRFVTLKKTEKTDTNGAPIYESIDSSLFFDWMKGPQDEKGNEMKDQSHALTGAEFKQLAGMYQDHIERSPMMENISPDDVEIEVRPYKSYPASTNNNMLLSNEKSPLYRMSHSEARCSLDDSLTVTGKFMCVSGIIQISPDKPVKINGKWNDVPMNWANNLHANGYSGHVDAFIRTSQGYKVEVHEDLKFIKSANTENKAKNEMPPSVKSARVNEQTSMSKAPAPQEDHNDDADFDPFNTPSAAPSKTKRFGGS